MCGGLKEQSSEEWTIVNFVRNEVFLDCLSYTNIEIEYYFLSILRG